MNPTLKQTRLDSYLQRPVSRADEILRALGDKQMTARQLMYALNRTDMNEVRPRLTELEKRGLVRVVGKAYDVRSKRNNGIYERVKKDEKGV